MTRGLAEALARFQAAAAAAEWPKAADALADAVRIQPDDAGLHYNLALASRLAGRGQAGLKAAQRALDLAPRHPHARFELGACALDAGAWTMARDANAAYLRANPGDADAALNVAAAHLRLNAPKAAKDALENVAGPKAARLRAEALRDIGEIDAFEKALGEADLSAPERLKRITQGPAGRFPLDPARLMRPA